MSSLDVPDQEPFIDDPPGHCCIPLYSDREEKGVLIEQELVDQMQFDDHV